MRGPGESSRVGQPVGRWILNPKMEVQLLPREFRRMPMGVHGAFGSSPYPRHCRDAARRMRQKRGATLIIFVADQNLRQMQARLHAEARPGALAGSTPAFRSRQSRCRWRYSGEPCRSPLKIEYGANACGSTLDTGPKGPQRVQIPPAVARRRELSQILVAPFLSSRQMPAELLDSNHEVVGSNPTGSIPKNQKGR